MWAGAKNCKTCGLKRSFKDVLAGTETQREGGTSTSGASGAQSKEMASKQRAKLVTNLQKWEAALSQLPEDASEMVKEPIQKAIKDTKKMISACKPIGHQLEDAKAARDRARQRKEKALEDAMAAQEEYLQAEVEEERLTKEIDTLRDASQQEGQPPDAMQALGLTLAKVAQQLQMVAEQGEDKLMPDERAELNKLSEVTKSALQKFDGATTKVDKPQENFNIAESGDEDMPSSSKRMAEASPEKEVRTDGFFKLVKHRCRQKTAHPVSLGVDPYAGADDLRDL